MENRDFAKEYMKREIAHHTEQMTAYYRKAAEHIKNEEWIDAHAMRAAGNIHRDLMIQFYQHQPDTTTGELRELCALMDQLDAMKEAAARKQYEGAAAVNNPVEAEEQHVEDLYIIKWQVKDLDDKWAYRYLGGFNVGPYGSFDYDSMVFIEGAFEFPEAVAEWLYKLLAAEGLYPEMEKI